MRTKSTYRLVALICALLYGIAISNPVTVKALSLIPDKDGSTGVILHITPNDGPSSGNISRLHYYLPKSIDTHKAHFDLVISSTSGGIVDKIPVVTTSQAVMADYVFPTHGSYTLTLSISDNTAGQSFIYTTSTLVSRGKDSKFTTAKASLWPTASIVLTVWILTAVIISAFRHRNTIRF